MFKNRSAYVDISRIKNNLFHNLTFFMLSRVWHILYININLEGDVQYKPSNVCRRYAMLHSLLLVPVAIVYPACAMQ